MEALLCEDLIDGLPSRCVYPGAVHSTMFLMGSALAGAAGKTRQSAAGATRNALSFVMSPAQTLVSGSNEGEEIRIDHLGMDSKHAVRIAGVDLQRAVLNQLDGQMARVSNRNNLIIIAVENERRDGNRL